MNKQLLAQCEKSIDKAITEALGSYNSPLVKAVSSALDEQKDKINNLASESVNEIVNSDDFKQIMKEEMKRKLSRVLISQYGGEVEKAVNELKSNPLTRAKITTAIDTVISESL
ncbi:MAG: hypothetical protein GY891_05385 [Bacteroidetes bacterium]|nr:hypothetical protein [Bacteroidota bacterium]